MDWWRSASFVEPWGSYRLERLRLLKGGGDVTLPAPLGQPPLLVRAAERASFVHMFARVWHSGRRARTGGPTVTGGAVR